jgi:hypothetical protein
MIHLLFQVSSSKPSLVGLGKRKKEKKKGKRRKKLNNKKKDFCCQVSLPKMPN